MPRGEAEGGGGRLNGGEIVGLDVDFHGHDSAAALVVGSGQGIKDKLGLEAGLGGESSGGGEQGGEVRLRGKTVDALGARA